jgi:hypothetical protein
MPSYRDLDQRQKQFWNEWVAYAWATPLIEGQWLEGHCPMHDKDKTDYGSAQFNFNKGVFRCQRELPCHSPKRAMSISNLRAWIEVVTEVRASNGE